MTDAASTATSNEVACPSCDRVYDLAGLRDGETARCTRCGHFLTTYKADELDRVLAYSSAAIVMMVLACSFPFMSFSSSGLESQMTLPQTAMKLWEHGMPSLALIVAAFILLAPAAVLLLVFVLTLHLKLERSASWLSTTARVVSRMQTWAMVEVFIIGVLVSLVKIAKMATIVLGISFWSYVAFAVLFTLTLTNLDVFQYWRRIEALTNK